MKTPTATSSRKDLFPYFDALAPEQDRWSAKNAYYHGHLARVFSFCIPPGSSVLEVGSGTGQLLEALQPRRGVGIDFSPAMVRAAQQKHPHLEFRVDDVENLRLEEKFEYIVVSDLIGFLHDVQRSLENLHRVSTPRTRVIISYHNFLWEPILKMGERLGLKAKQPTQNWLGHTDIQNL